MSSIAAWNRPSTFLLLAVLGANLVLPLTYLWSGRADAQEADHLALVDSDPGDEQVAAEAADPVEEPPGQAIAAPAVAAVEFVSVPDLAKLPPPPAALPAATTVCRTWGPFDDADEAESMAAELELRGNFEVARSEAAGPAEYLVTINVHGPREMGRGAVASLEAEQVESYVMERDANLTVLSVGVFSTVQRAMSQQERVGNIGFEAEITALQRTRSVYHLVAHVPADLDLAVAALGACGDIAPARQFL